MGSSQHNPAGRGEHPWALLGLLPIVAVLVLALKDSRHPARGVAADARPPAAKMAGARCTGAPGQPTPGVRPAARPYQEAGTMTVMAGQRGGRVVSYGQPWEPAAAIALGRCVAAAPGRA